MSSPIARRRFKIAIIGAGFGGIAAAVKLQQDGFNDFTVFEKSDGPAGTWRFNVYPGAEVDVPSHAYSYSFLKYDWSRTHVRQPELLQYANDVIDHFGLAPHFRYNTAITSAVWNETTKQYTLRTEAGEESTFDVVVSSLGLLSNPRYPNWPGLDSFAGTAFHTANWDDSVELAGKKVAIVGTGSTAVQIGPEIAPVVEQLTIFQREPGWIMPKDERDYTPSERMRFRRIPGLQKLDRFKIFRTSGKGFKAFDTKSPEHVAARDTALAYIEKAITDPEVRKAVTPTYPYGCKRIVRTSTFYPMLNRPNVELVPLPVVSVTEKGVVDEAGVERPVDVLILSTGFQPTKFLAGLDVVGVGGQSIHSFWNEQPEAFLGITVPGFPNFFMLYGPNTNGATSIIAQLERQAEVLVRSLRRMRRTHKRVVDTRPVALTRWSKFIDQQLIKNASAMEANCNNYYHSATGRNVTQWPQTHAAYYALTKLLPPFGLVYR